MGEQRIWLGMQIGLVVFWLGVAVTGLLGYQLPWLTTFAAFIFLAHVLEIPLAFNRLKGKNIPASRVMLRTLVFGFTWWLPLSKGYTQQ